MHLLARSEKRLEATSEEILQHNKGSILVVAFAGDYPPGSDGNKCAAEMVAYVRSVLAASDAAAVLFDFRKLNYTWGDAIGRIAGALQKKDRSFRPSAIVAVGRTALALGPLLEPNFLLGVAGTKMFSTMPEAVDHLKRELEL